MIRVQDRNRSEVGVFFGEMRIECRWEGYLSFDNASAYERLNHLSAVLRGVS